MNFAWISISVAWHYQEPGRLGDYEAQALEHNVIEWVLTQATVGEKPTAFAELMAPQTTVGQ